MKKDFLKIVCVVLLSLLVGSCSILGRDPVPGFTINNFTLRGVSWQKGDWAEAPSEIKSRDLVFQLKPEGDQSDQLSPDSKEICTAFKITCDSILSTDLGDFAASQNLTKYFGATDSIVGAKFQYRDYFYTPRFLVTKSQNRNFKFTVTLDDGRVFEIKSKFYELTP